MQISPIAEEQKARVIVAMGENYKRHNIQAEFLRHFYNYGIID